MFQHSGTFLCEIGLLNSVTLRKSHSCLELTFFIGQFGVKWIQSAVQTLLVNKWQQSHTLPRELLTIQINFEIFGIKIDDRRELLNINKKCEYVRTTKLRIAILPMNTLLTGSTINLAQGSGTCCLLAAGNTLINCSSGRNYNFARRKKKKKRKEKVTKRRTCN